MGIVPSAWLPPAKMQRIILHWTAGSHKASDIDKNHYHILVEGDGDLVKGNCSITANQQGGGKGKKANHTRNCNSGSIGVSMCAMHAAKQHPFDAGAYPLTQRQWDVATQVVAELCKKYGIPVSPKTVLTHAEVQSNLGIAQSGKWDIAKLPWDPSFDTARECGDRLRTQVKSRM